MAFTHTGSRIGFQPIASTETTQMHPLGTIVTATDPTYGEGTFVYLKGVASTATGNVVIYDNNAATTKRAATGDRGPIAIAQSANVANQFGWYQVQGTTFANAATVAANGLCYLTASAAQIDDAVSATNKIDGMNFKTTDGTPSAGFAIIQMHFPSANGNG